MLVAGPGFLKSLKLITTLIPKCAQNDWKIVKNHDPKERFLHFNISNIDWFITLSVIQYMTYYLCNVLIFTVLCGPIERFHFVLKQWSFYDFRPDISIMWMKFKCSEWKAIDEHESYNKQYKSPCRYLKAKEPFSTIMTMVMQ